MAKSVGEAMAELRQELIQSKQKAERLRAEGQFSDSAEIERRIEDAKVVLARWKNAD
jgi:hypothetical protein